MTIALLILLCIGVAVIIWLVRPQPAPPEESEWDRFVRIHDKSEAVEAANLNGVPLSQAFAVREIKGRGPLAVDEEELQDPYVRARRMSWYMRLQALDPTYTEDDI